MKAQWGLFLAVIGTSRLLTSSSWATPAYPEPTEKEMRQAIERAMVDQGGTRSGSGEISIDNPLNGLGIRITEFTKLGCEAAFQGPGYICSYHIMGSMAAHSNDGTRQGDKHAAAINQLLRLFMGGRDEIGGSVTRRFLKMGDAWTTSPS